MYCVSNTLCLRGIAAGDNRGRGYLGGVIIMLITLGIYVILCKGYLLHLQYEDGICSNRFIGKAELGI